MSTRDTLVSMTATEALLARPWYRYFWPWFVIGLVSSAVIGSLASAYLAVHTTDVVVEHDDASE
jgi:hypothetical protein